MPDSMRRVTRKSISEEFELRDGNPIPQVTLGAARLRVIYAGACYTEEEVINSGERRPKMPGVQDTSLFPGYEVSGIVDAICPSVQRRDIKPGDRAILFLSEEEEEKTYGYSEFILVKDANNLIRLPDSIPLDIGAILPCGALMAYCAVQRVKPYIEERILANEKAIINILIVGAGGLGLWTLRLAEYYIGSSQATVHLTVADTNIEQLDVAKEHGCYDVIHWDDALHEEYIIMRIKNVCKGGVDAVIDFVSSARTVNRSIKVLKEGGVMVVGGNSKFEVPICLNSLARKHQSILGSHRGTRDQLQELVDLVAHGQIKPPVYSVYPVEDANRVFKQLSLCKISGRAVFRVTPADYESSVFFPDASMQSLRSASISEEDEEELRSATTAAEHDAPDSPAPKDSTTSPTSEEPVRFHL